MASAIRVVLPPEARGALEARARRERVTLSRAAAEVVCADLGVDLPPRVEKTLVRDGLPEAVGLAVRAGRDGVTVREVAAAMEVSNGVAWKMLKRAREAGMVDARRGSKRRAGHGGQAALVHRATDFGRRVAEAAAA